MILIDMNFLPESRRPHDGGRGLRNGERRALHMPAPEALGGEKHRPGQVRRDRERGLRGVEAPVLHDDGDEGQRAGERPADRGDVGTRPWPPSSGSEDVCGLERRQGKKIGLGRLGLRG
jgi:hypothetical protein